MYEDLIIQAPATPASPTNGGGDNGLFDSLLWQESRGKQLNADGTPITSKKGAIGIAQVMPGTAREAAKLAGVEYDDFRYRTDSDYNRQIGKAYFDKQLTDFGDEGKALAAYNAGPGAMRNAQRMAEKAGRPDEWLRYLPAETQAYVPAIMNKSGRVPGANKTPTAQAAGQVAGSTDASPYFTPARGMYASLITPPLPDRSTMESVKDTAVALGSGVAAGVGALASVAGADNAIAKGANDLAKGIDDMASPYRKEQRARRAALIQAAEDSGSTWEEIKANAGALFEAPIDTVINAVGSSAPTLLASVIPGLGQANAARLIVQAATGAAQGAGSVKGSIYESVQNEVAKKLVADGMDVAQAKVQAEKVAAGAQAYDSQNGKQIALGALLGAVAGTTGAEASAAHIAAGGGAAARGMLAQAGKGFLKEGSTEAIQGGQERVAGNIALQNEGFDTPTFKGAAGQAVIEGLAGGVMGGGFGAVEGAASHKPPLPPALAPVAEAAAKPNSPVSRAAMAGNTPEAIAQRAAQEQAAQPATTPDGAQRLAELEAITRGTPEATDANGQPIAGVPSRFFTADEKGEYDQLVGLRDASKKIADDGQPKADTITDRIGEIETRLRDEGVLQQMREEGADVKGLIGDLAVAKSPSTNPAQREQALARVEYTLGWSGSEATAAETAGKRQAPADPIAAALTDQNVSAEDRQALMVAQGAMNNPQLPQGTRDVARSQALEIAGRYAAPTSAMGAAPSAPAAVLGEVAPAPGSINEALGEADRFERGAQQFREAGFEPDAQQLQDQADSHREEAATRRAAEMEAARVEDVAAPAVRVTPPGAGAAVARRRRTTLDQLVDDGLNRVERRDDGFYLVNQNAKRQFKLDNAGDAQMARAAIADSIKRGAAQANTSPTEGQKSAGNYKTGEIKFDGLTLAVENPQGSERSGVDPNGEKWSTIMPANYGYIRGSAMAADGDKVDIYLPDNARAGSPAWVIDQYNSDGSFDETKTVLGVATEAEAIRIYDAGFSDGSGPSRRRAITQMPMEEYKAWMMSSAAKKPAAKPADKPDKPAKPAEPAEVERLAAAPEADLGEDPAASVRQLNVTVDGERIPLELVPVDKLGARAKTADGKTTINKSQARMLQAVAKTFGKQVVFFSTPHRIGDGFVRATNAQTIYLNQSSGISPMAVFGHELMHLLELDNPKSHAAIKAVVAARLKDGATEKMGRFYSKEQVLDEITSDLSGDLMSDPKFWSEVFDKTADDSAVSALIAAVRQMVSKLIASFKQQGFGSTELVNDLEAVRSAVRDAMADYARANNKSVAKLQADTLRAEQIRKSAGRDQTQSEAFKRWFGDSKVVDAQGQPLVVYHGTTADFSAFDAAKIKRKAAGEGFYFTTDRAQRGYAEGEGASVMPVYLSIQKPTANPFLFRTDESYDGLIFPLTSAPGVTHMAVRRPEQIKSAIGNRGTFDPKDPDITRSAERLPEGVRIVEVEDGFDAMVGDKRVGRLRDNLPRGAAELLDESASVDIVKVENEYKGKGVGSALYDAFNEKHGGRIIPSGKTSPEAWALWKRKYPEKVDAFVKDEANRIKSGADPMLVVRNITDPQVARRVSAAAGDMVLRSAERKSPQGDLFQKDFASKRTKVDTGRVINSKGDTIKGGNIDSAGNQIAPTRQALENFWKWFGDSETTDEKDRPILFYHTTRNDFSAFEADRKTINSGTFGDWETTRAAMFFTDSLEDSQAYGGDGETFSAGANVMPVYLKADDILDLAGENTSRLQKWDADRISDAGLNPDDFHRFDWSKFDDEDGREMVDGLKRAGFNGVRFWDQNPHNREDFKALAVFDPEQVKSATGNRGTFDPADADITRSVDRGIHYSKKPRSILDGRFYGTGMKGAEARRLDASTDPRLKSRIYAYLDGRQPESGVGGFQHEIEMRNLYDATRDPLGLWNRGDLNASESAVLDAGFDGYKANGVGVLLGDASHAVKVNPLNSTAAEETFRKGLMSKEIEQIVVGNIPGATLRAGALMVPARSREQANSELSRIGSPIRFSAERIDEPRAEYADVEKRLRDTDGWMKGPGGQPTKLTERQWIHVRTPSFKKWFGDWEAAHKDGGVWAAKLDVSKAVGSDGEPLVIYHGTGAGGFMKFKDAGGEKRGDLGIFMTPDRDMAMTYVRKGRAKDIVDPESGEQTGWRYVDEKTGEGLFTMGLGDSEEDRAIREKSNKAKAIPLYGELPKAGDQPGVYALFANIRNPHESHFEGAHWNGGRAHQWIVEVGGEQQYDHDGRGYFSEEEAKEFGETFLSPEEVEDGRDGGEYARPADDHYESTDDVVREARRFENDGAVIREVVDDGGGSSNGYMGDPADVFVAFTPNQIKSADFNDGSYIASDDDIRRSKGRSDAGNRHGFWPELQDKVTGRLTLPKKALFTQTTNNANAARQVDAIEDVLRKFPAPESSISEWNRMMGYALADRVVPAAPYEFIKRVGEDSYGDLIGGLSTGQIADADHGFQNAAAFRELYRTGDADVVTTGKLALWSFLSRGVSPYVQESLFMDAISGIEPWVQRAAAGKFDDAAVADYLRWSDGIAAAGSGQPGAGSKHNLNAFGTTFLARMSQSGKDGRTHLQRLHDLIADEKVSGPQIRREFAKFGEGVGIDNKVVSFTLLVSGRDDVMVLDRVQIRGLWDDGRFADVNLYDGVIDTETGKTITGSKLSDLTTGARGLLIYEAIERAIGRNIGSYYEAAGRPGAGSVGRFHWETWVAYSGQEASHGTIDGLMRDAAGNEAPYEGITAKEGEYGSYAYGTRYGVDRTAQPYFLYENSNGKPHRFDVESFRELLATIKKPSNKVVPTKFLVSKDENGNNRSSPWFEDKRVNREALDRFVEKLGTAQEGGRSVPPDGAHRSTDGAGSGAVLRSADRDGGGQQRSPEEALLGAPSIKGATGPDPRLVAIAEAYAQKVGAPLSRQAEYVQIDPERARRIADAYESMLHAPQDPSVKAAYKDLIEQTTAQYQALVDAGYEFYFADQENDPYGGNPWNAMRDLRANQRMAVFPTAEGFGTNATFDPADNPLLADTGITWPFGSMNGERYRVLANDLFRAVHDAFGHGLEGSGFRAQGEENAWQAHVRLFHGPARGAITTETRGQNSWLNYGPHGEANRTAKVEDTVFADQKTGLMPEWTWREGKAPDMETDSSINERIGVLEDLIACLSK